MRAQKSVQARFGSVGLPTAIHENDKVFAHFSDLVVMQEHMGDTINSGDHSVIEFEIFALGDGGIHQGFDLTHLLCLVDSVSIAAIGAKVNPPNHHLCLWVPSGGLIVEKPVENYFSTG